MKKGKIIAIVIAILVVLGIAGSKLGGDNSEVTTTNTTASSETTSDETEAAEETSEEASSDKETTVNKTTTATTAVNKTTEKAKAVSSESDADFELTMLDVGQGLSILIKSDGKYMLYDGGGRDASSYVVSYLKSHNITNLTYMFASHYDEDHIAGLVGVLNTTKVGTVVDGNYTADSNIYKSFCTKLASNGAKEVHPTVGTTYSLGSAKITVISPKNYSYDSENSYSVAIRITYGSFSAIITGDAESDAEADMVSSGQTLSSDLYVVGHHGSSSSSTASFVKKISPSYAFISVGAGNSYGHPTQKTLNTLKNNNVQIFRSDKQGEVTCYSNGSKYWFSEDPCNDYTAGGSSSGTTKATTTKSAAVAATASGDSSEAQQYVLNTHTKKFHYPTCNSVSKMDESNKEVVTKTRDELIAEGYSPCGNCDP